MSFDWTGSYFLSLYYKMVSECWYYYFRWDNFELDLTLYLFYKFVTVVSTISHTALSYIRPDSYTVVARGVADLYP